MRLPGRPSQLLRRWPLLVLGSLLVLLALAFAAPAAAQPIGTLVNNNTPAMHDNDEAGDFTRDYATSFTTGGSREGYTVTGVDLYMRTTENDATQPVVIVRIHADDSGLPGTALGTFATASRKEIRQGPTFEAVAFSGSASLAHNTTYWVSMDVTTGGVVGSYWVSGTSSEYESPGAYHPGWSIGNNRLWRSTNNLWARTNTSEYALRMNLRGYANDSTPPVARSGRLAPDGMTLKLYYDEELDPDSIPATTHFKVKVAATDQEPSKVTVAGSTVTLTLSTAATAGQSVAVSYDADAAGNTPVRNLFSNKAGNLAGLPVANEVGATVPQVTGTGVSIVSKPTHDTDSDGDTDTYGAGAQIEVQLTWGEAVTVDAARGKPRLKIKMHAGFGEKWAVYERGSGTTALTFAYTVVSPDTSKGGNPESDAGIAVLADTLELTGGTIRSTATGRDASVGHTGPGHNASHKVDAALDGQAPRLVRATVTGRLLTVTFDETLDHTSKPEASKFCVRPLGGSAVDDRCGNTAGINSGSSFVMVALIKPVRSVETVTLSYQAQDTNPLQDMHSNKVAGFSGMPATNTTDSVKATIQDVDPGSESGSLTVNWMVASHLVSLTASYDLRYYAGTSDPPAGREADWIEAAPGLPDPGMATSATIKGLLAGTPYRVQVRAVSVHDEKFSWSASGAGTTADAPSGNEAPRVLRNNGASTGNHCEVDNNPLVRNTSINAPPGTSVGFTNLTGRRAASIDPWPTACSSRTFVPYFDDTDDVDIGDLTLTAEMVTLPENVRVQVLHVQQQSAVDSGSSYNFRLHEARLSFIGAATFRDVTVYAHVTARDPHGASATRDFGFEMTAIGNENGAPTFSATVPGQEASTSREVSLVLPEATGGDIETRDVGFGPMRFPYHYLVTGLPEGLVFDPGTRTISGTPLETGAFPVTYTADDADSVGRAHLNPDTVSTGDHATTDFTITVAPRIDLVRVVSSPTHDANGDGKFDTYGRGDTIVVDVEYSEPVEVQLTVGGKVGVRLLVGRDGSATLKRAEITGVRHGGKTLRFAYEVQRPDFDPDGVQVGTASGDRLVLLTNASVTSVATGADAELTKSGLVTGGAVGRDGIPITYVNGRVTADGPKPESATVNGDLLRVVFDEDLDQTVDTAALPFRFGVQGTDGTGGNRNALSTPPRSCLTTSA